MNASLKSLSSRILTPTTSSVGSDVLPSQHEVAVSDIDLVARAKRGDRAAFTELVRRHQRGLLRLVLRMTRELPLAEDIVQETFIKAYEKMDLFEGRSSFKSWLYQVGLNTAKNRFRSRSHEEFTTDIPQGGVASEIENDLQRGDIAKRLRGEIDRLPERQRVAITLRVFEDLSFKEIAQIMNCPYDTAKANYRHALLKLREAFESELEGGELENWNSLFGGETENSWSSESGGSAAGARDHQEVEL